jgi:hypothetical protein
MHLAVRDCIMKKLKPSDLAVEIVDQYRHAGMQFRAVGIEKPANLDQLEEKILEACRIRLPYGILPLQWLPIDNSLDAKTIRVKNLQLLTGGDPIQLHWVYGCSNLDLLWDQLENFIPGKRSGKADHKRDDGPDTLGLANKWLIQSVVHPVDLPNRNKSHEEQKEEFMAAFKANEPSRNHAMIQEIHRHYFPPEPIFQKSDPDPPSRYTPAGIMEFYRKRVPRS